MAKNSRQKVPKSDFQSQFSTSKIVKIFIEKIFVEASTNLRINDKSFCLGLKYVHQTMPILWFI